LKLLDKLLLVGVIEDSDLERLLIMIDPITWDPEKQNCKNSQSFVLCIWINKYSGLFYVALASIFQFQRFPSETEDEEDHRKGLLYMELAEGVKLQMCYLLHHMNDIQLRHRVESIVAFSYDYIAEVQAVSFKNQINIVVLFDG